MLSGLTVNVLKLAAEYFFKPNYQSLQAESIPRENCAVILSNVIAGCGHFIAEEKPEELTQQLLAFFGEDSSK